MQKLKRFFMTGYLPVGFELGKRFLEKFFQYIKTIANRKKI
jgi:hypothetical protein